MHCYGLLGMSLFTRDLLKQIIVFLAQLTKTQCLVKHQVHGALTYDQFFIQTKIAMHL